LLLSSRCLSLVCGPRGSLMITSSRIARNAGRTIPCFCAIVVVLLMLAVGPLEGAMLFFNTSDSQFTPGVDNQGWWSATFSNSDTNANYATGEQVFVQSSAIVNDFFTFDLSSL